MEQQQSKLEEIYDLVKLSKKTGIELTEDQLRQISEREEQYIKEEVLPILGNSIEPILQKIQRDLTLVVNYRPGEPISLRISHNANLSDLEGAVTLTPDDIPAYHKRGKHEGKIVKGPSKKLVVTMQTGIQFYEKNATETFCKVIEHIGLTRVRNLGIMVSGLNVVSTSEDPNRQQRQVGNFHILVNTSTQQKADILKKISDMLNIDMKIEIIN